MIDRTNIGKQSEPFEVDVEAGQLKFFAKATAETNPIYFSEEAARSAGYDGLPAPPTFAFSLNLARPDPFKRFSDLGIPLAKMLHGEQRFDYSAPIYARDTISLQDRIVDIFEKKNGALEFVVTETTGTNQNGKVVVRMTETVVVRNG